MARNRFYSGPVSDHFDGTRFFIRGHDTDKSFKDLLRWSRSGNKARWPGHFPSPFADRPPQRVEEGRLRVTLIGHASFLVQASGLNILIDPVYAERASPFSFAGPKRVNAPGIAFENLPPVDVVIVSHAHYDHLDLATLRRLQQRFAPRFLCPLGNDPIVARAGQGLSISAHDWWETVSLSDAIKLHLVPSYHWSARGLRDRRMQLWSAFVISTPAGSIYHIADTAYADGMFFRQAAKRFGPFALAHIPIGAYEPRWFMEPQHVNPAEAVQILKDCGAAQAIGHHWGTFQLTDEAVDEPLNALGRALESQGIAPERFQAFRPGQVWASP